MKLTLLFAIFIAFNSYGQKVYVNNQWELTNGTPVIEHPFVRSEVGPTGNIYTIGNKNNGSNSDIYLQCASSTGNILWTKDCASSATVDDWAADIAITNAGDVIVTGALYYAGNYDYSIEKYSASGSLIWQQRYHHYGNDIPSALAVDGLDNIYVTGASIATTGFNDFATLKINGSDGSIAWTKRYDHIGMEDIATDITINGAGQVAVTGSSADNYSNSQFTILVYDATVGAGIGFQRHDSPGIGFDIPSKLTTNASGQYIIAGTAHENLADSDLKIIVLDAAFNVQWAQYFDNVGAADKVIDMTLTSSEAIIVTGYVTNIVGGTDIITAAYTPTGVQNWKRIVTCADQSQNAYGFDLNLDNTGNIISAGTINKDTLDHFRVACYDDNGNTIWTKSYGKSGADCIGSQVVANGADICAIGTVFDGISDNFSYINYSTKTKDVSADVDVSGNPTFRKHELFVAVHPDSIIHAEIDNQKKLFWEIDEIFTPGTAGAFKNSLAGVCGTTQCKATVYKVFKQLKTTDTVTTSRLGETIKVPEFWATFLVEFSSSANIDTVSSRLDGLFPMIPYNHKNPIIELASVPNDTYFVNDQLSLSEVATPGISSDAHINVQDAWDQETGQDFIKCGVFDTELLWNHEDFGDGTFAGTRVKGGWNFRDDYPLTEFDDATANAHGTKVAGIIGALRNNDLGVAGIAGGDFDASEGISLYGLTIFDTDGIVFNEAYDGFIDAIVTTSMSDGDSEYNFGINVANHSWGSHALGGTGANKIYIQTRAFLFSNKAKVTNVAGRGNSSDPGDFNAFYPAVLHDDWILTVAQTGTDGQWKDGEGDPSFPETSGHFSKRGGEIDCAAPGLLEMIYTTSNESTSAYGNFLNTSAATPHVTGLVALLMSHHNSPGDSYENLAPEDCEHIIQYTADDTDTPGYDDKTGWGRINAAQALKLVDSPSCQLRHFGTDVSPNTKSYILQDAAKDVNLTEKYQAADETWYNAGWYNANVYKVSASITHPVAIIGYTIEGIWSRHSSSNLLPEYGDLNEVQPRDKVVIDSYNETTCNMHGYIYELLDDDGETIGWWPFELDLANAELTYTLLRCDEDLIALDLEEEGDAAIELYPNPSNGLQTLSVFTESISEMTIQLIDNTGRLVQEVFKGQSNAGNNTFDVSLEGLANGMYFFEIVIGEETRHIKTIKG